MVNFSNEKTHLPEVRGYPEVKQMSMFLEAALGMPLWARFEQMFIDVDAPWEVTCSSKMGSEHEVRKQVKRVVC